MRAFLEAERLSLPDRLTETSLAVPTDEFVCLVGPNGSGKTSLLHAIGGIGAASGEVRIDGIDPCKLDSTHRRRLYSYLPASRDVLWPLTAEDLVALGLPPKADRSAIPPLLDLLELSAFSRRRVDRMSTGERSRVLIARALVAEPRLLLLDEPVANLDPRWQLLLMEHLRALAHSGGRAVIAAVHDLDLASRFADRLLVMNDGRLIADGQPAALLDGDIVRAVFGIERVEGRWQPIPQMSP